MWQLKHQNYWGFLIPEVHSEEIQNWLADQSTEIGCLRFQEALHRSTTKQFLNQGTLVFIYFFLLIKLTAKVLHTPNWRTNSQMQTEQNRQEEKEHGNICIRHTNHTRCSRKKNTTHSMALFQCPMAIHNLYMYRLNTMVSRANTNNIYK